MSTYTREELRNYITHSSDFTAVGFDFTLENNATTTAYFAIEGASYYVSESGVFVGYKYKDVFNSASLSGLTNCTVVSGSSNAGFIIDPSATATFTFTPTSTISKDLVLLSAPNVLVYNINDLTASGSTFGVDLFIK